ncbi:LCP family protein [Streptomyces sp. S07_1.15]|uniref:LCP family protein n=1 Tax=Streptomyces sp. S07_1.15 TaxID=2873925 RepID=UPI001D15DE0E|nr:LCP family protein [Streptomyces sp. S07_1.15]MCC3653569.1 LCP family protein [Streptomyces sp. S07_1.15]
MTTPAAPGPRPDPSGRTGGRRSRRSRWGLRLALCVSAVVLSAAGAGHAVVGGLGTAIERVDPFAGLPDRPARADGGDGLTFLLVGTDGRDRITAEQRRKYRLGGEPCHCTDAILLVHLSADRRRAGVVSIPRDSYAELPADAESGGEDGAGGGTGDGSGSGAEGTGGGRPVKINSVYAEGGPRLTVRTVENLTRVRIDHYLEVDFSSFIRTVDLLGGVDICTTRPLRDPRSGLDLPAGTSRLDGGEALAYVRARHLDAEGDLGRMRRQQLFLAALMDRAAESGLLLNPVALDRAAGQLLRSVRADPGLGPEELIGLGRAMRGFTAASSEFVSVPVADPDHRVPGIGSTVLWDQPKAEALFEALREDRPLTGAGGHSGRHDDSGRPGGPGPAAPSGQPAEGTAGESSGELTGEPAGEEPPRPRGETPGPGGETPGPVRGDEVVCP